MSQPLTILSDDEEMFRDAVAGFANDEVRPRVQISRPTYGGGSETRRAPAIDTPPMKLGQRVRHATFGDGVVVDYEGTGSHTRVQVKFERDGQKWLVLAYANLTML